MMSSDWPVGTTVYSDWLLLTVEIYALWSLQTVGSQKCNSVRLELYRLLVSRVNLLSQLIKPAALM